MTKLFLLAILISGSIPARATTISLMPGNTLRVNFSSDPTVAPCPDGPCDVLTLNLVLIGTLPAAVLATVDFYDGTNLLGTSTGNLVVGPIFKSATSAYPFGTIVNFSALQGPFSGYFDVTSPNALSIDATLTNVLLGHALSGEIVNNPNTTEITSIAVVPEPGYASAMSILLFCAAFGRLFPLRRKPEGTSTVKDCSGGSARRRIRIRSGTKCSAAGVVSV